MLMAGTGVGSPHSLENYSLTLKGESFDAITRRQLLWKDKSIVGLSDGGRKNLQTVNSA